MLKKIGLFCASALVSVHALAATPATFGSVDVSHSLAPHSEMQIPNLFWTDIQLDCVITVVGNSNTTADAVVKLAEGSGTFNGRHINTGQEETLKVYTGYKLSLTASYDALIKIENKSDYTLEAACKITY